MMSDNEDWDCPLCMEEMDIHDRGFKPCECGYQICSFCYHRIKEDMNGQCPACRRLYSEQVPNIIPVTGETAARLKRNKKAKDKERREIESMSRHHLVNVRVMQKNLVYVLGLPAHICNEDVLKSNEYFGQFGKVNKVVVVSRKPPQLINADPNTISCSVYITYNNDDEATVAIDTVDNTYLEDRLIRATNGTTKYCPAFLRHSTCQSVGCMYLHEMGNDEDSYSKEDMQLQAQTVALVYLQQLAGLGAHQLQ
ncbi:hypothetical protein GQ42DRAFT_167944 [Ramicandelaber brevisporus]|nr:hypothetical protein GQ42DRAFT_167944 [Ramicandelaber brevisporus]